MRGLLLFLVLTLGIAGCATASLPAPTALTVRKQIVTQEADTTEAELLARAQAELAAGQYAEARRDFELLVKSEPDAKVLPVALFGLGSADEGLGAREAAEVAYRTLANRFPELPVARTALVRSSALEAVLEQWDHLAETGEALLKRPDLDNLDHIGALASRGLARVELGDTKRGADDIQKGLDVKDAIALGQTGKLPSQGAELEFAHGEVRRVETEGIALQPVGEDFVAKVSARCQGLLDAQEAYAQAMRTTEPQWALMAGYRLGAMYERLHHDLMAIPADGFAKTEKQHQIFYGIMHVRYRALLDKALIMLQTTLDAADRVGDKSAWVTRGREQRAALEGSLAEEKATLAKFPFTEQELEKALQIMQAHAEEKQRNARP